MAFGKVLVCIAFLALLSQLAEGKKRDDIQRKGQSSKIEGSSEDLPVGGDKGKILLDTLGELVSNLKKAKKSKKLLGTTDGLVLLQIFSTCNPDPEHNDWKAFWEPAIKRDIKELAIRIEYLYQNVDIFNPMDDNRKNVTLGLIHGLDILARNTQKRQFVKHLVKPPKRAIRFAQQTVDLLEKYSYHPVLAARLQMLFGSVVLLQQVEAPSLGKAVELTYKNLQALKEDAYVLRTGLMLIAAARKGYKAETVGPDLVQGLSVLENLTAEGAFKHSEDLSEYAKELISDLVAMRKALLKNDVKAAPKQDL